MTLLNLASKARLPVIYGERNFADAGALMSYGANYEDLTRRSAGYVDKILKGAKPADLPIEQPTRFELVVNLRTAKALGIAIPQSILLQADEVIRWSVRVSRCHPTNRRSRRQSARLSFRVSRIRAYFHTL